VTTITLPRRNPIVSAVCQLLLFVDMAAGAGCGPTTQPMVQRLPPESQQQVDVAWDNMLTPPSRLDRALLLDVIVCNRFHQTGVDRLVLRSEKRTRQGTVVLEVNFEKNDPARDEFVVRLVNSNGVELRRERYSRNDVETSTRLLWSGVSDVETPDMTADERADVKKRRERHEQRARQIQAATQPAGR